MHICLHLDDVVISSGNQPIEPILWLKVVWILGYNTSL